MTRFQPTTSPSGAGVPCSGPAPTRRLLLAGLPLLAGPARAMQTMPLRLGGSGMGLAITRMLLDLDGRAGEALGITVLSSLGTSGGLAALSGGRIDLAVVSRDLSPAEISAGLAALPFARTPIGFATRQDTPVDAVTTAQAAALLAGGTREWSQGVPVRLVRRDRSETDWIRAGLSSPILAEAMERAHDRPGLAVAVSDQDNADLLERLPGSFGLTTLGQTLSEYRGLRLLPLDGVAPEVAALQSGRYRMARSIRLAWRRDAPPWVTEFVGFLATPQAGRTLLEFGFEPLTGLRQ
ncbi:hypothetical protein HB662_10585 [Roseomonas frigidaquae]|uniref:PBP domain-containing protein n=1 Tax=Falsiroseomonas frigidaquae TaxID=487318 RepID=A0ABX1EYR5_9PROT|nr:substrate-binding domain-containing protein [Falsiroseomonas frigidaquae]NKE45226.1 hypothetical protein [Falsiroseomonas frigidaquae]